MRYSWAVNIHDDSGDAYDKCIAVFVGEDVVLKFSSVDELMDFAMSILASRPELSTAVREQMQ